MSQQVTKIKTRIKSVSSALKVTSAMKLVSTVKLKKWKNKMLAFKDFSEALEKVSDTVLRFAEKVKTPFNTPNESNKNLYILISSTLGLCGSYNSNIFKLADAAIKDEDDAIILGNKGLVHFQNGKFTKIAGFNDNSSSQNNSFINSLSSFIINEYIKGTYREIHLIYSEYRNSLVFLPKDFTILPLGKKEIEDSLGYGPILEPTPQELVDTLMPIYLKTVLNSKILESEVCEQAARSNAMENATDNAQEILDELQIQFNKARQGAITQEITEIVAASNAL
ncbi:MAG: ATP synthase F1 subunit gamma [Bacilli bacterium]|nr:ATP synthase F1 subunit gamma [Bacilli bacterium]